MHRELSPAHGGGPGLNREHDIMVAGAAADITVEFSADCTFIEVVSMAPYHVDSRHDHAGSAKPTLQTMFLVEGSLHRMQRLPVLESFDRGNGHTITLNRKRRARLDTDAVDMDGAGTALAGIATDVSAGKPQVIPKKLDEQRPVLHPRAAERSIHRHPHNGHVVFQ
jgi:hypothetical protein